LSSVTLRHFSLEPLILSLPFLSTFVSLSFFLSALTNPHSSCVWSRQGEPSLHARNTASASALCIRTLTHRQSSLRVCGLVKSIHCPVVFCFSVRSAF
jgi:hypothetical protein